MRYAKGSLVMMLAWTVRVVSASQAVLMLLVCALHMLTCCCDGQQHGVEHGYAATIAKFWLRCDVAWALPLQVEDALRRMGMNFTMA